MLSVFKGIYKKIKFNKGNKEIVYISIKYDFNKPFLYRSAFIIPRRSFIRFFAIPEEYSDDDDKDALR